MKEPENIELGPTRLVVNLPRVSTVEIVAVLDVLDQLLTQIWESHCPAINPYLLERRRWRPPEERAPRELPF